MEVIVGAAVIAVGIVLAAVVYGRGRNPTMVRAMSSVETAVW